jgi:hypothetical protein
MRRERGSAFIFVLIMVLAISFVVMAAADSSMSYVMTQKRLEDRTRADYALKGAREYVDGLRSIQKIPTPFSYSISESGVPCTITGQDSAKSGGTIQVTSNCTIGGRSFIDTYYLGKNRPTIYYYALAVKNNYSSAAGLTVGKPAEPGHTYGGGPFSTTNAVLYGDVDAMSTVSGTGTLSGTASSNVLTDLLGSLTFIDYLLVADTKYLLGATLDGVTFAAPASSTANYPLIYVGANLNLKGSISGIGTIYVAGNLTINGKVTAFTGARLLVIVNGSATISDDFDGYVFAKGNVTLPNGKTVKGGVYTQATLSPNGGKIEYDQTFARFPDEATRMRAPGI